MRPRVGEPHVDLPAGVEPASDWEERVRAAHAEGYGVVAGAIAWEGGAAHRRPHELEPYVPGGGRQPGFSAPLLCPSVLDGVPLERLADVAGLPAYAAPRDEPWLYDGRIVLQVTALRNAHSSTAIRSSTAAEDERSQCQRDAPSRRHR